jgi:hypothetical protein
MGAVLMVFATAFCWIVVSATVALAMGRAIPSQTWESALLGAGQQPGRYVRCLLAMSKRCPRESFGSLKVVRGDRRHDAFIA